ncbi:MAG: site-specific DNA-methyltransferase [Lachnospiraceae bacterium]|nr:site-specific DNA-methyltransferase [Lachnospiraceae bacterium]
MEKERAGRNRTITLSDSERLDLKQSLHTLTDDSTVHDVVDKTFNQDILEAIKYLPKHFVDLLVIDPPYNLSKDFAGFKFKATGDGEYLDYVRSWLPKVLELLKPNGSVYVCCDWKSTSAIYQVLSEYAIIKNRITWQREKGRGAKSNWKNAMEDIWFGVLKDNDYFFDVESVMQKRKVIAPYKVDGKPKDWEETEEGNFRITYPSNFWDDISIPYWSMPENTDHPTQKPEKLIAKLILASCPKEGIVFDPFLGSGTTSVVAKKLGRHFCGTEINEEYALLTVKRLNMADNDKDIQGYCDGVFWERNTLNLQKKTQTLKSKKHRVTESACIPFIDFNKE